MKSSAKNIRLTSVDDLFSTEASREEAQREKVQEIPLEELHPFPNHPFKVLDDDRMLDTAESIREHGRAGARHCPASNNGRVRADCRAPAQTRL